VGRGFGGSQLRRMGLVGGIDRMLVGFGGLGGNQLNALLGAAIHVLNHPAVGRGQRIQFVDPVPDGPNLSLHVRLAGHGVGEEIYYVGIVTLCPACQARIKRLYIVSFESFSVGPESAR
jgi:hypothetical protein